MQQSTDEGWAKGRKTTASNNATTYEEGLYKRDDATINGQENMRTAMEVERAKNECQNIFISMNKPIKGLQYLEP
eukprot:scaffold37026_cov36-Cyclotella_meneghiniana.AAC.1